MNSYTVKMFNYIIFHEGCIDGFSGLFVTILAGRLTSDVIIYGDSPYTKYVPQNITGKDIIIIDVAYKKEILENIFKTAKSVVFIDHHISISNDIKPIYEQYNKNNNIQLIYNEQYCGSLLTWKYFFGDKKIPVFLKYVDDSDRGIWKYPKTKPFIMALRIYYKTEPKTNNIAEWKTLLDKSRVSKLVKIGTHMKKYNEHIISINVEKHVLRNP